LRQPPLRRGRDALRDASIDLADPTDVTIRIAIDDRRVGSDLVMPSDGRSKRPIPSDRIACRRRTRIERMFAPLEAVRRVATRHDKLVRNVLASAVFAATIVWWLN
jgi:transposase